MHARPRLVTSRTAVKHQDATSMSSAAPLRVCLLAAFARVATASLSPVVPPKPPEPPCCFNCTLPAVFYYSVVTAEGYCGVSCLDPAKEWLYKKFEANLTRAPNGTTTQPCATQFSADGQRCTA